MSKKPSELQLNSGFMTLPAESGQEKVVDELAKKWGAETIRDSDGTMLSDEMVALGYKVYSTLCLVRAEQEWPKKHKEELPRKFLMSDPIIAQSDTVEINPLDNYYTPKYEIDTYTDPKEYWEVIDRTTGELLDVSQWDFNADTGKVTVQGVDPLPWTCCQ